MNRSLLSLFGVLCAAPALAPAQPVGAPIMRLGEIRPGMRGEVWTVFHGIRPEPFTVEVVGVIRNALGPGKNIILGRLTDARVQKMGAGAGMSGSPLYIDGRLAGALSYQLQRFETIPHAGFTPIEDLMEVSRLPDVPRDSLREPIPFGLPDSVGRLRSTGGPVAAAGLDSPFQALTPELVSAAITHTST